MTNSHKRGDFMSDITKSIRKYSAAYCEYPSRILAYSPSILVRILRIHRVSSRIGKHTLAYSPRILGILAYSRVFAAYLPRILRIRVFSRIRRVFSRILVYSRVFLRILRVFIRVFSRILASSPRIRVGIQLYVAWVQL